MAGITSHKLTRVSVALGRAWQCVVWSWLPSRGAAEGQAGGPGGGRRQTASEGLGAASIPSWQRPLQLISLVPSNHGELEVSGMLIAAQLNISP